ncbi:MAG: 30S ribosomal protein S1 [Calditrichae bacterium]|nr:30S ribosomal protein S1 [Calditrichota bacterium]MCB9087587.1 30S ribosomal protein S1 [Calditrichia bacterium]
MSDDVKQQQLETEDVQAETPSVEETQPAGTKEGGFQPGQVVKLEDLEAMMASEEDDPSFLMNLYEQSFEKFKEDDIVKGTIAEIGATHVIVDLGFKSEGIIPIEEFIDLKKFKVGDDVELFLESPEDAEGNIQVSRRKVYFLRTWDRLMSVHENGEVIQGRITRRIKGGFVVDLEGVDAFLPGSQVDVKPIRDFDAFVNQTLDLKIVKVNAQRKNIVVSRRAIIEKELESKRAEILSTLQKGQVRRGVVKNITDFGVFIDLGGVDGLLHITDLSWGRVNHPSELVNLDEEIDVMILDFDENKSRISLGLKQLKPHPWENIAQRFPVGSKVKGKVVSLTDYGAFVELEHGIEGLIHVSEMSWSHHVKNPAQILKEGEQVEAVLLSIEPEERKISLGLKQLTPDPWEDIEVKYPVSSRHKGVVRNLTPFGAFVELEEGVDGLVHISDLSWTRKIRHPSEVIRKGEEIEVVVLDINKEERRIALGHKQVEANPWDAFENAYQVNTEATGKIVRLIDKGVIVTLPLGVDAFVPLNQLGKQNIKRAADHFKVGDDLPLKVIEFDKENKRIVLSVSEYLKGKEKEIIDGYMAEHALTTTTLKDMVEEVPELEELPEEGKGRKAAAKKKGKDEEEAESVAETSDSPADAEAEAKPAAKAKKTTAKASDSGTEAETDTDGDDSSAKKSKSKAAKQTKDEAEPDTKDDAAEGDTEAGK